MYYDNTTGGRLHYTTGGRLPARGSEPPWSVGHADWTSLEPAGYTVASSQPPTTALPPYNTAVSSQQLAYSTAVSVEPSEQQPAVSSTQQTDSSCQTPDTSS